MAVTWLAISTSALAATSCPDPTDTCACLGKAGKFDLVGASSVKLKTGKVRYSGYSYPIPASVLGSLCASSAVIGGRSDAITEIEQDAVSLAGPGETAIRFKAAKVSGYRDPGTTIGNDLVTGGGAISGLGLVEVNGSTDTTGSHPDVADCQQALLDAEGASMTLGGLTPTQSLGTVVANNGSSGATVISTTPGVNVIATTGIVVNPQKVSGYAEGSELTIDMDSASGAIIINDTGKLSVGEQCIISVTGPGADPSKVIINLASGGGVKVSTSATVEPVLLAPGSNVSIKEQAVVGNVYGAKATVKGAQTGGVLACSPGGAFL